MRSKANSPINQGMSDIVSIADIGDFRSLEVPLHLEDGHVIRHCLARVTEIREPIDDGNAGIFRHFFHGFVAECTDHDSLDHAFQIFGDIAHSLSLAEVYLSLGQTQGKSSQLMNADIEGDARPERGLFKNHGERFAVKSLAVFQRIGLDCVAADRTSFSSSVDQLRIETKSFFFIHDTCRNQILYQKKMPAGHLLKARNPGHDSSVLSKLAEFGTNAC